MALVEASILRVVETKELKNRSPVIVSCVVWKTIRRANFFHQEAFVARVTGVGGVFLRSVDPARLASWYGTHLGLSVVGGTMAILPWTDEVPAGTGQTIWSAFPHATDYLGGSESGPQAVMINYRVDDLEALLEALSSAGVRVDPKRDDSEFGRFAWIWDCDGNRLELWQPPASE